MVSHKAEDATLARSLHTHARTHTQNRLECTAGCVQLLTKETAVRFPSLNENTFQGTQNISCEKSLSVFDIPVQMFASRTNLQRRLKNSTFVTLAE